MTSPSKTWQHLRDDYLRQVERALSSVRHPRTREVLEDVGSHLDRRLAELAPDRQTAGNLRAIIADMGPAADYAELLEPETVAGRVRTGGRSVWHGLLAAALVIVVAVVLIVMLRGGPEGVDKTGAEALAADGWSVWRQQKFGQAETLFAQAVEKDPTHAHAWNGLGWAQFNQGKRMAAMTSFEKCLDLEPAHAAALNGLGWIARQEQGTDEAIDYWQRAVEALPSATAALNGLATTYMETQQYDKAIEIYEKWLRVEPNNAQVKADLERAKQHMPTATLDDLPQLLAELSNRQAPRFVALNRIIQIGAAAVPTLIEEMRTSNDWQIPKALGAIGDERAVLPLIEKLEASDFSPMREVVGEALERITGQTFGVSSQAWRLWWEKEATETPSSRDVRPDSRAIYIVTFEPVAPFAPQTSRQLLAAFNEQHPRDVRTHHYRTQVKDGALVGSICVDTEAGKDAVAAMLATSAKLALVEAVLATPEALERLYEMGQPSLSSSGSRRARRRTGELTTCNSALEQTGSRPAGNSFIRGSVSRRGRFSRADHAYVQVRDSRPPSRSVLTCLDSIRGRFAVPRLSWRHSGRRTVSSGWTLRWPAAVGWPSPVWSRTSGVAGR